MSAGPRTSACTRGPGRDRVDVGQPRGVLDLRLDADAARRQAVGRLELASAADPARARAATSVTLGSSTTSRCAPAAATTSITSAYVHGVVQSLTRTPRSCPAQPSDRQGGARPECGPAPWRRARPRPRDRGRPRSAAKPLAFSIILALLPGTERQVLRGRYRFSTALLSTLHAWWR